MNSQNRDPYYPDSYARWDNATEGDIDKYYEELEEE